MKNHFLISDKEKNRIRNLHESRKQSFGTGKVIKEQTTEKWVVNSAGKNVGSFDPNRKLKFIVNGDGKKEGLESGPAIPSGTKLGKPRESSSGSITQQARELDEQSPKPISPSPTYPEAKDSLIKVLTNHLNKMKTDDKVKATQCAQIIYNDCANFLNKKDLWTDTKKYGPPFPTEVPFAPDERRIVKPAIPATPAVPALPDEF